MASVEERVKQLSSTARVDEAEVTPTASLWTTWARIRSPGDW